MRSKQCINIGIIGGRDFKDIATKEEFDRFQYALKSLMLVCKKYNIQLNYLSKENEHITIVSGGASGADTIAEYISVAINSKFKVYEAEWENFDKKPCKIKTNKGGNKYNCLAGFNRNTDIVENCDILMAFWDTDSSGTLDSIKKAMQRNKNVELFYYES